MKGSKAKIQGFLQTGQNTCHDSTGRKVACRYSGQDAEYRSGLPWPETRFECENDIALDRLTGLFWPANANLAEFPLDWNEALSFVADMNSTAALGFRDRRLPNRRELRSLICHQSRQPALPADHPFNNVFPHWYWTSTSTAAHPDHAWYINMDGGRMFYGGKNQAFMLWPVRGTGHGVLTSTGQQACYDIMGGSMDCENTGQDGELQIGIVLPEARCDSIRTHIRDRLTGLLWHSNVRLTNAAVNWQEALQAIDLLNQSSKSRHWRLPNINEPESLVDCSQHSPALPATCRSGAFADVYWSSTTSVYEPDWAWALYINDGAVGVGQKSFAKFDVWAVTDDD